MEKIRTLTQFTIIVKSRSPKSRVVGFDERRDAYLVDVHAPPEDNKANIEVVKLFTKLLRKKITILSGMTSKKKVLRAL